MISLKDTENKNLDEKKNSQKNDDKQNEESTLENNINEASFCDKNSKDNSMPSASDVCESVDISQQMDKFINLTKRKLDEFDITATDTSPEIAKQFFNEPDFRKNILKNVNFDPIDMDGVKKALANLKSSKDSVFPRDTVENNILPILPTEPPQHGSGFVPSKSSEVQEKPNSERNTVSKTVSSDKPKLKVVSSLKPGTLRDLENTKLISSSLHIESLRPVAITNVKSTNRLLQSVNDTNLRDPRQNKSLLLNSNNSFKPIHSSSPTNPQVQTPVPSMQHHDLNINSPQSLHALPKGITLSPTPVLIKSSSSLSPLLQEITPHCSGNISFPQHELPHSTLPGYNMSSVPISSSMPVFEKPFNNSNPSTQIQYRHNRNEFNYDTSYVNQYPNSYQPYVNSSRFDETRYSQSESNNCQNGRFRIRDPRLAKSDQKSSEPPFRNYKEFRLAKHGREKSPYRGSTSGVHELNRYRRHTLEKDDLRIVNKKKTYVENNKRLSDVEIVCDKAKSIKDFKIPKLKHKDEIANHHIQKDFKIDKVSDNTKKYKSETVKSSFADKYRKSETITDKKFASIKDSGTKNFRKTETIMDKVHTEKRVITDSIKNVNSEVKKTVDKNDKEKDFELELILESIENCSKTESSTNLTKVNATETKSRKSKKYSKEREFEKIVKEAVASSKDGDVHGPRTRTRNSIIKKDETLKNNDFNATKQNDNGQNSVFYKCSVSISNSPDYDSCQNTENDISKNEETGQNIISSTSKEPSEADFSTEVVCSKSQEEKTVASNEINSTADVQSGGDEDKRALEELMNIIKTGGAKKLVDLLKSPHFDNIIKSKPSENSGYEQRYKKKLKKKKKNKKKLKKYSSDEEPFENERKNELARSLDENNLDTGSAEYQTEEVKSCTNDSNYENDSNSDSNSECMSSSRVKYKSKKDKNHQPYRKFAILKDKSKVELKDLKIVISKYDKKSGDAYSVNNQPVKVSLQNEPDKTTQSEVSNSEFETTGSTISKQKAKLGSKQVKKKINSESVKCNETYVSLKPAEVPSIVCDLKNTCETVKTSEEMQSINENETEITMTDTNLSIKSRSMKKPRSKTSELDKLHAYTSEMYDCNAILNISNVRHCRTNKQIDYTNTGTVFPKKSNVASVQSDSSCDHRNETFDQNIEKPKSNKNGSKPSTFKINKNKKLVKRLNTITTVIKKSHNVLLPSSKNKSKSNKKTNFTKKKAQLNVPDKLMVPEKLPKIVSEIDFVDKLYFQNRYILLLECKFCHYSNTALNVVRHYKELHCEEEVLPSRLSKDSAERLINESLKNNFIFFNSEDLESYGLPIMFTCVFCECSMIDFVQFFDHLTSHTGEYRYKCKMCEKVYSCENELENHILEHSDYDKTDGISLPFHQNPVENVFGYLCPFCYYVQINYDNLVKHMELRHVDDDKKNNGHWTVIRVYLSLMIEESYKNSAIDYANLVGCLPPSLPIQPNHQVCQTFSKTIDPVDKTPIAQLVVEARMNLIGGNAEHVLFDKPPQEIQNVVPDLSIKQDGSSK